MGHVIKSHARAFKLTKAKSIAHVNILCYHKIVGRKQEQRTCDGVGVDVDRSLINHLSDRIRHSIHFCVQSEGKLGLMCVTNTIYCILYMYQYLRMY